MPDTITELMTNANLIAWLKSRDPNGTYSYSDSSRCALTQFVQENGFPNYRVSPEHVFEYNWGYKIIMDLPPGWDAAARNEKTLVGYQPRTYGNMLTEILRLPD